MSRKAAAKPRTPIAPDSSHGSDAAHPASSALAEAPPVPVTQAAATRIASQPPAIPLTKQAHDDYTALYEKLQSEIQNTNDAGAIQTLMAARDEVKDVLDLNDEYTLKKNTGLYDGLLKKVEAVNTDLAALKDKIAAVATRMSDAAGVLAAIDKVVTLAT